MQIRWIDYRHPITGHLVFKYNPEFNLVEIKPRWAERPFIVELNAIGREDEGGHQGDGEA